MFMQANQNAADNSIQQMVRALGLLLLGAPPVLSVPVAVSLKPASIQIRGTRMMEGGITNGCH